LSILLRHQLLRENGIQPACTEFGPLAVLLACRALAGLDLTRSGSDGNPIIWIEVLESGRALFGPPAESFVPRVTLAHLGRALRPFLEYAGAQVRAPTPERA
jgi:hypothetical protein